MSLIDEAPLEVLKQLQAGSGTDLLQNLVDLFVDGTPPAVDKIEHLFEQGDFEQLAREAHSLKSSSANLGASELSRLCKEIEYKIVDADSYTPEEISGLVKSVREVCLPTIEALKAAVS